MKFEVGDNGCADEIMEELTKSFDDVVGKDPESRRAREQVAETIGLIKEALERTHAPSEIIQRLDELEEKVLDLECADIKAIGRAGWCTIAFSLGVLMNEED